MDQLPPELLAEIVAQCDWNSIFRLREVSKYFNNFVTPQAFETVYVGWIPKHFEHLRQLATSPIAKHIRCLAINTQILPVLRKRQWLESVQDSVTNYPKDDSSFVWSEEEDVDNALIRWRLLSVYSDEELKVDRKNFANLAREQQEETPGICETLIMSLRWLENLQHLKLIDKRGVYRDGEELNTRSSGPLAACSPWKDMLIDPYSYYSMIEERWDAEDIPPSRGNISSAYVLHYLAESLAPQSPDDGLRSLLTNKELTISIGHHVEIAEVFNETDCEPCEICWGIDMSRALTLRRFQTLFKSLERVNLQMNKTLFHYEDEVCSEIAAGLYHANNIRHMELDNRESHGVAFFDAITSLMDEGDKPWPFLERLRLSGEMTWHHLWGIINLNAETLRVLELVDLFLEPEADALLTDDYDGINKDDRWDDFLEEIQPLLNLTTAKLRHLRGGPMTSRGAFFAPNSGPQPAVNLAVEDFLTKKIALLPRQEHWESTKADPDRSAVSRLGLDRSDDEPHDLGALDNDWSDDESVDLGDPDALDDDWS